MGNPPIVDQQIGRWYWSLNPTLDRSFHGESVNQGVVVSPNAKFSYELTRKVAAGLEYYGSVGPVTGFDPLSQQQHQIFPAIDLNIAPQWELNFGLGVGLTGSTDHLIAKMILGYRSISEKEQGKVMLKGVVIGFVLALLIIGGGLYYYFAAGMAPVATGDPPMPFERMLSHLALDAHIGKQATGQSPVAADETAYLAGARCTNNAVRCVMGCRASPPPTIGARCSPTHRSYFMAKG